jgi:HK97 family phage prohead protease
MNVPYHTRAFSRCEVRFANPSDKREGVQERGTAYGYATVFNADSQDLGGYVEQIAPTAFARTLGAVAAGQARVDALWSHDWEKPLGSTSGGKLSLSVDQKGLAFELDTTRLTPLMLDALADNDLRMSFGFSIRDYNLTTDANGLETVTVTDLDLYEISFVVNPAYPQTSAALRSLDEWRAGKPAAVGKDLDSDDDADEDRAEPVEPNPEGDDDAEDEFEECSAEREEQRLRVMKAYVETRLRP